MTVVMTVAEAATGGKVWNTADIEFHGGARRNSGFVFPDGSRGPFSGSRIGRR
jgi:hypothetical protein